MKVNNIFNDTCLMVYTNQTYLPIANLTMSEFDRLNPNSPLKRYLVSNKIDNYKFNVRNTTYIDCDVQFDGMGGHFSKTMRTALSKIQEEYIIFFCDDYMLIGECQFDRLNSLLEIIKETNVDFFSFASMLPKHTWQKIESEYEKITYRDFYIIPDNYPYQFSVQPCIWKKSSLLELLEHNPNLSLHHLDTSNIVNREGHKRHMNYEKSEYFPYENGSQSYGLKCVCTDYKGFDELTKYEYFIFPYIEIIRHGLMNMSFETNTKKFLENFIIENKLNEKEELKKFLY